MLRVWCGLSDEAGWTVVRSEPSSMSVVGDEKSNSNSEPLGTGTVAERAEGFSSSKKPSIEDSMTRLKEE